MKPLNVPPAATRDSDSVEMMRVWIAEQGLHCSLKIGMYADGDPAPETKAWGIILADAVQHLADALQAEGLGERAVLLDQIVRSFEDELNSATSKRSGGFVPMN
jgi:hypothetical protein